MESAWTAATTAASLATSLANAHPVAKEAAAAVGRRGGRGGHGGGRGQTGAREQDNQDVALTANQGAPGSNNGKFQEIREVVGSIHGRSSLPPSNDAYKRFVRELNAVISTPPKPLEWSGQTLTFDPMDHCHIPNSCNVNKNEKLRTNKNFC